MQAGGACSAIAWSCPAANDEKLLPGGDSRWGILLPVTRQSVREQRMRPQNLMAAELSTAVLHKDATLAPPWQLAARKTQLKEDPALACLTSSSGRFCCFQHWGKVGDQNPPRLSLVIPDHE